jgi:mannosyltransferase OCH1-like enzyme
MYEEVIEQIKRIGMLENTPYFIYPIMKIDYYDSDRLKGEIPLKLSTYKDIQIPKVIHYCWFGRKEKPLRYKKWMESWKYYCPDYEIVEWNENNYEVYKNKYIAQAYEMQKWAFVADYARVDIISQYGGIYLDTDVELIKNIDELLMNDAFCGFESTQFVNYGLGFGAKKSHPIVDEIKKYYDGIDFIRPNGTLNQITCPMIQTEVMKRYGLICNGRFQIVDGMAVYPSRVLCGMSPHSLRVVRDLSRTYAIHHFEGSWTNRKWKNQLIPALKRWSKNTDYIYPDA